MSHPHQSPAFDSFLGPAVLIGLGAMFLTAVIAGARTEQQDNEQRSAVAAQAVYTYVQAQGCVGVARHQGVVTDFRCEKPGPAYHLTAQQLQLAALPRSAP